MGRSVQHTFIDYRESSLRLFFVFFSIVFLNHFQSFAVLYSIQDDKIVQLLSCPVFCVLIFLQQFLRVA